MPLSVGVLIIGSLLWDSEQNRPAWRKARLDMTTVKTVTAPIRYGRRSGRNRGNTYTMVFSRSAEVGQGKVVQCTRSVFAAADLVSEAQALWKAELPTASAGRIAADWGCVAVLCNPERKIPEEVLRGWAMRVADEPQYGDVPQAAEEGSLVSETGLLQIAWPRLVEGEAAVQLDLLLVTANHPTLNGTPLCYPPVETIARAWNEAGNHVEYFWRNSDCEIRTFQDDEIRALLHPREQA